MNIETLIESMSDEQIAVVVRADPGLRAALVNTALAAFISSLGGSSRSKKVPRETPTAKTKRTSRSKGPRPTEKLREASSGDGLSEVNAATLKVLAGADEEGMSVAVVAAELGEDASVVRMRLLRLEELGRARRTGGEDGKRNVRWYAVD